MMLALRSLSALAIVAGAAVAAPKDQAPSVGQALGLKPIQPGIEYDQPTGAEAKACSIQPEREGKGTSWVVRDAAGRTLRRFADTNADNVVDTWCYYQDGLEVYRDVDADYDSRADQYRWFHTGGSRWGIDTDQDTKIDRWRQISPQEVAEEAIAAVRAQDADRFERLVISTEELRGLGVGKTLGKQIDEGRRRAVSAFKTLARSQKTINSKSRFVDFGAPRPGVIPTGVDGSTKDVTVYENASALVDNGGTPEQLLLGSLVRIGEGWRLIEAPSLGSTGPELANVFSVPSLSGRTSAAGAPSENMQQWMADLEKLDRRAATAPPADQSKLTDQRVAILEKLANAAQTKQDKVQWFTQLADLLSAAAQSDGYEAGVRKLASLEKSKAVQSAGSNLVAHLRYRRIGAQHGLAYRDPKADYAKVQEKWVKDLEAFVTAFPQSGDAADAMIQLGSMAGEFAGEIETAQRWYGRVSKEFPRTDAGKKATGALRRLGSIGKTIPLRGPAIGGGQIDLAAAPYRGRHVLVHYWATWSGPEADMKQIEALRKKYRGKLEVIGVNLDSSPREAQSLVSKQRTSWKHLYDEKGLDGKLANDMGVMTLPLMLLVDQKGRVVNRNLHSGELATELERLIR